MTHFAGLDVSLDETAICVVDATGQILKETRAASEPSALIAALTGLGLPLERVGLEACSLTAWLHDVSAGVEYSTRFGRRVCPRSASTRGPPTRP